MVLAVWLSAIYFKSWKYIRIPFAKDNTIREEYFSKTKDKVSVCQNSDIVCSIRCLDCNDVYIGETSQFSNKNSVNILISCTTRSSKDSTCTTLASHSLNDGVSILGRESTNVSKRKLMEILRILNNYSLNFKTNLTNSCIPDK